MNGYKHHILILIHQLDDLLRSVSVRNTHQACKAPDTVVDMYHIIARFKHIQFLERQCHFSTTRLVTAKVVFMESVKNLMVRKHTNPQRMVHKPFMQRTVYRFKGNVIASFLKNIFQTFRLLHAVRADIQTIFPLQEIGERTCNQIKILVENWLYGGFERQACLRSS